MSVQIATLDILTKRARFDSSVALAIAEGIELESEKLREDLATKRDLLDVRTELKTDIAALRTELKADIAQLRYVMELKIEALKSELMRWWVGTLIGAMATQTALMTGIMYFLLQNSRH